MLCYPLKHKIILDTECACKKGVEYVIPEYKNKELPQGEKWSEKRTYVKTKN